MTTIRPVVLADAPALAELTRQNRAFLAPWEPLRPDDYFTDAGFKESLAATLGRDDTSPFVILDEQGELAGRITLNSIIRGAFQSCSVGYWLSEHARGRGLATAALREVIDVAFGDLNLHRIQAETLVHNVRSQRMLERTGFARYGLAPTYLKIAGEWQDHVLFQLISPHPV